MFYTWHQEKALIEDALDKQSQWEILKYEIWKFSIRYSKIIAKKKAARVRRNDSCDKNIEEHHKCKVDLDEN